MLWVCTRQTLLVRLAQASTVAYISTVPPGPACASASASEVNASCCSTGAYKASLKQAFGRTVKEARFAMVVVDAPNLLAEDLKAYWSLGQVRSWFSELAQAAPNSSSPMLLCVSSCLWCAAFQSLDQAERCIWKALCCLRTLSSSTTNCTDLQGNLSAFQQVVPWALGRPGASCTHALVI